MDDGDEVTVMMEQVGGAGDDSEPMVINVKDSNTSETIQFKIKPTTKFGKVIKAYCTQKGVTDMTKVRFTLDGTRIHENDTPKMVRVHFVYVMYFPPDNRTWWKSTHNSHD